MKHAKKQRGVTHTKKKKRKKQAIEPILEEIQMDIANKDFKNAILNMLRELQGTILYNLKEDMITS